MILPMLWIFTENKLAPWLLNAFSKNLNASPSSWLNIPDSESSNEERPQNIPSEGFSVFGCLSKS